MKGVVIVLILGLLSFVGISYLADRTLSEYSKTPEAPSQINWIVVLGNGTQLTDALTDRLNNAILAHQLWPQARILITGDGKAGEIKVMKEYLLENGIEEDVVVEEDKSTSTWSSFVNLKNVIPNEDFTLIVTNEYHQRRSIATATLMGYRAALFGRDTVTLERRKYYKFREHLSGIKWYLQYLLYKI